MSYNFTSNQTADTSQQTVQLDLIRRGWIFAVPYSRDARYDLIVDRGGKKFETIQIKTIDHSILRCTTRPMHCREFVSANGKQRNNYHYKDLEIDWIVGVTKDGQCLYYPYATFSQYETINIRVIPPGDFGVASVQSSRPKGYVWEHSDVVSLG